jgi:8-oxo-dGTP pyrophosphatase MutT (NUDIX family)
MLIPWTTLATELVFESKWYKLRRDTVRLPTGRIVDDYFVSVRPDVSIVFALTPDRRLVLVRQYKHGAGRVVIELPAGTFTSEEPIAAAQRELVEETGFRCDQLQPIGRLFDDATKNSNSVHMFYGTGAVKVTEQNLDENERDGGIEVLLLPLEEAIGLLQRGDISSQSTVATMYRALDALRHDP